LFVGRAGEVAVLGCATLRHSSTRARNFSAIEGAQYIKLKNPHADVTVRDLEGVEETIVIAPQQPQDPEVAARQTQRAQCVAAPSPFASLESGVFAVSGGPICSRIVTQQQ